MSGLDARGLSHWRRYRADAAEWFSPEEVARGRAYVRPLGWMGGLQSVLAAAIVVAFVHGKVADDAIEWVGVRGWALEVLLVVAAVEVATLVVGPWFSAWRVFVHDRRWELSTQKARGWVADQVKELLLGFALTGLLAVSLYAVIRATSTWWIWGWMLFTGFGIVFGFLYPVVFAPIFNRFERLEGSVASRVEGVAERAGLRISGVFVADASTRSRATNAYVAGLGRTRRVVLFDTILAWPPELIDQVVAHELGHWRHRHLARQIPLMAGVQLVAFFALSRLMESRAALDWVGVGEPGDPRTFPLLALSYPAILGVVGLLLAWVARAFERQADLHALAVLDDPPSFQGAFRRLAADNKADVNPPWWRRIRHTHPPVPERMAMAETWRSSDRAS